MNHDTPGAIPSDDLPFLGPAISPRRPVSGSPLGDADELAAPFVGGAYDPLAAGATGPASSEAEPAAEVPIEGPVGDAPWHAASAGETPWAAEGAAESEGTVEAREDEVAAAAGGLDSFPESDWPSDDFPWLSPSAPEPDEDGQAEAWRPGVDTGELSAPAQSYSVEEEASVQHLSWIGEPASQGEIDAAEAAAASAEVAPAEAAPADAVSEGQEGVIEVSLFAVEGVEEERTGFQVDAESVEGSWTGSESWAEEHAERGGEAWGGEATVEEAAPPEAEAAAGSRDEHRGHQEHSCRIIREAQSIASPTSAPCAGCGARTYRATSSPLASTWPDIASSSALRLNPEGRSSVVSRAKIWK